MTNQHQQIKLRKNLESYQDFFINTHFNFLKDNKLMTKSGNLKICELCKQSSFLHSIETCEFRNYTFCLDCIKYNRKIHTIEF